MGHLTELTADLDAVPGTVSVWFGRPGAPAARFARLADTTHLAASTMKVAVLAALYRQVDAGRLDLSAAVPVRNVFLSAAPGSPTYGIRREYDSDQAVWERLDRTAPLGWLAERMIVRSSNLAANLIVARVGVPAVEEVWSLVGAQHTRTGRAIEDTVAADAGIVNRVTAADLAALFGAIVHGADQRATPGSLGLASIASCAEMLATLLRQEGIEDLAAGLPPGTRVAHKNGWVRGVRHGAGVVFPTDAPPFVLAVCTTTPLAVNRRYDAACQLVARVARAAWADRHTT